MIQPPNQNLLASDCLKSNPEYGSSCTDAELLSNFVSFGDRQSIEVLIHRYVPMVACVCRSTVGDPTQAEDAFQATFLVLLKSAKQIKKQQSVAAWLHGVAYRIATRARSKREISIENQDRLVDPTSCEEDPVAAIARSVELAILDQELAKLSSQSRTVLVEHYLMGHTAPEISRRTGLSLSAVEGRIRRGKQSLKSRLIRRGVSLSVVAVAALLAQRNAQASEAIAWRETFKLAHLPEGASANLSSSPTISSLAHGETNMFTSTMIKVVALGCAALIGMVAIRLEKIGFGHDDKAMESTGPDKQERAKLDSLPNQTEVMAQLGGLMPGGGLGNRAPVAEPAAEKSNDPNDAKPKEKSELPKSPEPPKPITFQKPETDPPTWLELATAEVRHQDEIRLKLRNRLENVELIQISLEQVVEELSEQIGIEITLDVARLEAAGVDPAMQVNVKSKSASLRELLRVLIRNVDDVELAYIVREDSVEITTLEAAETEPQIRYYDLAFVLPNSAYMESVISAIENSISPDSWVAGGGDSTISVVGSMLIVSTVEKSHQEIERLLAKVSSMNRANLEKAPQFQQPMMGGRGMGMGGGMGGMGGGGMGGGMF